MSTLPRKWRRLEASRIRWTKKIYEVVVRQSGEAGLEYEDGPAY